MHVLDHSGGLLDRHIRAFGETVPSRRPTIFRRHFWVSPFPEEDIAGLTDLIGAEHVLFGSDWPHAEGTEQPADYAKYLEELDPAHARQILRDNVARAPRTGWFLNRRTQMSDAAFIDTTVPPSGTGCVECTAAGGWWFHLRRCA